ncbi:MAG: class I SAM-dependent methyltransferase [Thermostichales cyanobacterium HHBFW_bins_127]
MPDTAALPLGILRCLTCEQVGLAATRDRVYCPACGQVYPFQEGIVRFLTDPQPLTPAQGLAQSPLFAWGYERLWRPWALSLLSGEDFPPHREAELLLDCLGSPGTVLDLATGCGYWSRMVLSRFPHITLIGLDNSLAVLQEAHRHQQPYWPHYCLIQAQAEAIPLGSQTVEGVICGAALNELPLAATLAEVSRILQPGGVFVSMHSRSLPGWTQPLQTLLSQTGLHFLSEMDLHQAGSPVGLGVKRYLTFGAVAFVQMVKG